MKSQPLKLHGTPLTEKNFSDGKILFNHDQISKVFFIGFQDEEEFEFARELAKMVKIEE